MPLLVAVILIAAALTLLYRGRPYLAWVLPVTAALAVWLVSGARFPVLFFLCLLLFGGLAALFGTPSLRRRFVTAAVMKRMSRILPRISKTERLALEAGTIWWDGDLFSGRPDWSKLVQFRAQPLSEAERTFLDGPVEELCSMVDDFQAHRDGDLSPAVWDFIKRNGFFGMIIPREYGGLGFSAIANSSVVCKVASCSTAAAVTVMVPNSLGPAELLLHYGTDEQKAHYLPRLARAEEIPCFALTEPEAGSDAASGRSRGVVGKGTFDGREVLGMRLSWNKRYITLSPVATVLGLAFRLFDPDHLLGGEEDLGITCALIPVDTPGVEIGDRHDPLAVPFLNGPTTGKDVFVPLEFIIGGPKMAGEGWRMLMDCLAAGRSISLPALAVGAAKSATRITGAYATVREQFGLPIGRFEGIQERLGRIGGLTYLMDAARRLTAGAVDAGEKPSVLSAIVKAYLTEQMRIVINDAMDVTAGAGISRGPRNTLAGAYTSLPIGITVEGANILTRSLIVFGQGAIRCHPWVREEIHAVGDKDLVRFDRALFKHLGFTLTNGTRAVLLGLTGGLLARPAHGGPLQNYFGHLSRLSAAFTFLADVSMATLGGDLKRREMVSGRMADALAWMYLGSATLKRYVDDGCPPKDLVFARWGAEHALHQAETALLGALRNFPVPWVRFLRIKLFPYGATLHAPADRLTRQVANELLDGKDARVRLSEGIFVPAPGTPGLGFLELALEKTVKARPLERKLKQAVKDGALAKAPAAELAAAAREAGILSPEEHRILAEAIEARLEAVQVDAFPPSFLARKRVDDILQAEAQA
jgi:acyl-CoA dehydrogenase